MSTYTPMPNPLSSSPISSIQGTPASPHHSESSPLVPLRPGGLVSATGFSSPLSHTFSNDQRSENSITNGQGQTTSFSVIRTPGEPNGVGPSGRYEDWEEEYEKQRLRVWEEKVARDLEGWRGGNGAPRSSYPRQALPPDTYFLQPVTGTIGRHLPKEIVRVERDWSGGEVCRFETSFPMELEGRISPKQFMSFINDLNEPLVSAYSVTGATADNIIAVATLWTSLLWRTSWFERELRRAEQVIRQANQDLFNANGLNVLSPRDVALQFLEVEYY
ncbi:hypothetical protein IAR55_004778 [Kwoniella newhampshirensis]|uniref:Ras modification protein ERF4 n=1 Tax=Kwoniella newhampshirensis TaxID=1651941 RepID=A0AAW0YI55_9TREE